VDILYLLIPLSVALVLLIGVVFWFALHSGQFDDLEGPAIRILADDDTPRAGPELTHSKDAKGARTRTENS